MTRAKMYGDRLDAGSVGSHQAAANPTTKGASPQIEFDRFCRNPKHPSANLWNQIHEATNQAILYRSREIFRAPGWIGQGGGAGSGATQTRYRFAFRSGPYMHGLMMIAVMLPQDGSFGGTAATSRAANSYSKITIYSDATESTSVATVNFYHGANPLGLATPGFSNFKAIRIPLFGLTTNTNYYAKVEDVDDGRLVALSVYELPSMTENTLGYLSQNITAQTEIVDTYRENVATFQKTLWKNSGGLALNFCVDLAANVKTNNTNTSKNISDNNTTFSDATSGFKIDLTNHDRLAQTSGVPVRMSVFCKTTDGGGSGRVYLKNSTGTAVITITNGIPTAANGAWITTTGFLPASADKYDLHFDNNGAGTISVWSACIYEYEA
jgi:hypothetical protein